MGITEWFVNPAKLQSTWKQLIRILFTIEGKRPETEAIRAFQQRDLGKSNGNTCLLELFPLPSPGTREDQWIYNQISSLPQLATRSDYQNYYQQSRSIYLKRKVEQWGPKAVIFYGAGRLTTWESIAGVHLPASSSKPAFYSGTNGQTVFVVTAHPAARGITNEYFQQVGQYIRSNLR